jgi:hypothetical protein
MIDTILWLIAGSLAVPTLIWVGGMFDKAAQQRHERLCKLLEQQIAELKEISGQLQHR